MLRRYFEIAIFASAATLVSACFAPGCADSGSSSSQQADAGTERHLDVFRGTGGGGLGSDPRDESLCDLVKERGGGGAGIYEVVDIMQDPRNHPRETHVTYVRNKAWAGGPPKRTTVVYPVGPVIENGDVFEIGGTVWHYVEVSRGQVIGAVFERKKQLPGGYYLNEGGIFHEDKSGAYSNGMLFWDKDYTLAEVGQKIKDMYRGLNNGNGCPYDIQPVSYPDKSKYEDTSTGSSSSDTDPYASPDVSGRDGGL